MKGSWTKHRVDANIFIQYFLSHKEIKDSNDLFFLITHFMIIFDKGPELNSGNLFKVFRMHKFNIYFRF